MNDCYYEKKDWRVCKKEVSVESQPSIRAASKSRRERNLLTSNCRWRRSENVGSGRETKRGHQVKIREHHLHRIQKRTSTL